jgi:hypothetical protein
MMKNVLCISNILLFILILRLCNASQNYSVERIAFGSCFNPHRGGEIWKLIESFSPQQLILLGDQFYADMNSEFGYRKTKLETLTEEYSLFTNNEDWQHLVNSLDGWTATFDDHDYGINNGDKTFRFRNESQDLFWLFTNTSSINLNNERKSGVYSSKTVKVSLDDFNTSKFVYKIIMLDSRSNKDRNGLRGDFLGNEQWEWLAGELLDPEPQLFIIGSSIQVLPDDKIVEETWNEFPHSRTRLLKLLTAVQRSVIRRQNVLVLSGDIHSAEVSQASCALLSTNVNTNTISRDDGLSASTTRTNLVELTSSGLSHTFTHTNVLPNVNDSERANSNIVQVVSRGFTKEIFYSLYQVRSFNNINIVCALNILQQALYPAQYRELKFAHLYAGIHFGLLDIVFDFSEDLQRLSSLSARFSAIDHRGQTVVSKIIPFSKSAGDESNNVSSDDSLSLQKMSESCDGNMTLLLERLDRETQLFCEPYWGILPRHKLLLFKCALALAGFVCLMLPCLVVLWLLFASVYRLSRGHDDVEEALRCHRINEVHRILAEQNAKKSE